MCGDSQCCFKLNIFTYLVLARNTQRVCQVATQFSRSRVSCEGIPLTSILLFLVGVQVRSTLLSEIPRPKQLSMWFRVSFGALHVCKYTEDKVGFILELSSVVLVCIPSADALDPLYVITF